MNRDLLSRLWSRLCPPEPFDSQTEAAFLKDYARRFAGHRRASAAIAEMTWLAFVGWEYIFYGSQNSPLSSALPAALKFEIAGASVLALAVWQWAVWQLYRPVSAENDRHATTVICIAIVTLYWVQLGIMQIAPYPYNYLYYYIGLLVVLLFLFGFFRLLARPTLQTTALCVVASAIGFALPQNQALAPLGQSLHACYWVAMMSLLLAFAGTGVAVNVEMERTARHAFGRERELSSVNLRLREKNTELEVLIAALNDQKVETERRTEALVKMKEYAQALAEQKNVEKTKFLADAAHDFRQPMQALMLLLEAGRNRIREGAVGEAQQSLHDAVRAACALSASFDAVLDISRLESGFVQPSYSAFDVDAFVAGEVARLQPVAEKEGIRLKARRRARPAVVRSDRQLLERVLVNLMTNGIRYAEPSRNRRWVLVSVVTLPQYIRLEIVDNGVGIPAAEQANVFKPFYQLGNPERDPDKGLGLGLSIVSASIAVLQEHRIEVTSIEGVGTRFSLQLPHAAVTVAPQAAEAFEVIGDQPLVGLYVLLVENDLLIRNSAMTILGQSGALCEAAGSYDEFVQLLQGLEREPDVVISDYRLPSHRTAEDVADEIARTLGSTVPLLVLTGESASLDRRQALSNAKVLRKPITPGALVQEIHRACQADAAQLA